MGGVKYISFEIYLCSLLGNYALRMEQFVKQAFANN